MFFCDGKRFEIFWADCCHISYKTPEQLKDSGREIHPLFKEDYTYMLDGGPSHRYGMVEELGTDEESVAATVHKLHYSGREKKSARHPCGRSLASVRGKLRHLRKLHISTPAKPAMRCPIP